MDSKWQLKLSWTFGSGELFRHIENVLYQINDQKWQKSKDSSVTLT